MSAPNFNKRLERTVSAQVLAIWTILIIASYFISELWLKNHLLSHLILWLAGVYGLSRILSWYYRSGYKDTNLQGDHVSSLIYNAIAETSPDSVAVTDLLGNYIFANKQTAKLHGYNDPEELIGKSAFGFFPLNEVVKAAKYMEMTRTGGVINGIEFKILRKDGTVFPAELSAALIRNEFGIPVAFIAITRDITERKHIADQLHDMNEQLRLQLTEIEKLQDILKEQAIQDPLTGLYNRRFMEESLKQEFARASRANHPFSVVMLDMDNLKILNDKYGHAVGDLALKSIASLLQELTRTEDIVCRYGGDEFLIILHNVDEQTASARLWEWNERAKEIDIVHEVDHLQVSFSAGTATYPRYKSIEELIRVADKGLYEVKAEKKRGL